MSDKTLISDFCIYNLIAAYLLNVRLLRKSFDRCFRCWIIQKRLIVFNSHCIRYIWIKTLFINRFSGSIETWEQKERQANRYTNGQPETTGIELKRYFQHYVNITYSCTSCDKIAVCFCTRQAYRLAVVSVGRKASR